MKKGGTILLLSLTIAFVGFVIGMLVGRNITKESTTIHIYEETVPVHTQAQQEQATVSSGERININTASAKMLETLPGIGPVLAQRIVEYRLANGPFERTSDLSKVEGIGSEKLLAVLDYITVGE